MATRKPLVVTTGSPSEVDEIPDGDVLPQSIGGTGAVDAPGARYLADTPHRGVNKVLTSLAGSSSALSDRRPRTPIIIESDARLHGWCASREQADPGYAEGTFGVASNVIGSAQRNSADASTENKVTTITAVDQSGSEATSYQTAAAGSLNDLSIAIDTGTGMILAGVELTFAGHSTVYVAQNTLTDGGGTLWISPVPPKGFRANGATLSGNSTVPIDGGTGGILEGMKVKFEGHISVYTVMGTLPAGGGNLVLDRNLTTSVGNNDDMEFFDYPNAVGGLTATVSDNEAITVDSATNPVNFASFTRASGDFDTDGYFPGILAETEGFTGTVLNNNTWKILGVSALKTYVEDPTERVVNEASNAAFTIENLYRGYYPANSWMYNLGMFLVANFLGRNGKIIWEWSFEYWCTDHVSDPQAIAGNWKFDAIQKVPLYSEGALIPISASVGDADSEPQRVRPFSYLIGNPAQSSYPGHARTRRLGKARMEMECTGDNIQDWHYWEFVDDPAAGERNEPFWNRTYWNVRDRDLTYRHIVSVLASGAFTNYVLRVTNFRWTAVPGRHTPTFI